MGNIGPNPGNVAQAIAVSNQSMPSSASVYPFGVTLNAAGTATLDLTTEQQIGIITTIQAGFFDNSNNDQTLTISFQVGGFLFKIPPASQAWLPVFTPNPPVITFAGSPNGQVTVYLTNVPMPAAVWSVDQSASEIASTPTAGLVSSITTGGTAVTVFAANAIVNTADIINPATASEPLYVDFVNTASIGGATSIPIPPGGAYRISRPINHAVTAIAATTGHAFIAVRY